MYDNVRVKQDQKVNEITLLPKKKIEQLKFKLKNRVRINKKINKSLIAERLVKKPKEKTPILYVGHIPYIEILNSVDFIKKTEMRWAMNIKKKVLLKYLKFKILNKLDKKATPHPQILRYPQKLNVKYFKFRNKITKYNPKNLKMVKKLDKNVHDFLGRILKNKTEQKGLNLLGFFQNKKELNKKWAFFEKNTKDSTDSEHSHGSETSLRESYTPETPIQENCSPKAEITPETSTEEGHIAQVFTPEERELWEKHKLTREISAIFKKRYGSSLIV